MEQRLTGWARAADEAERIAFSGAEFALLATADSTGGGFTIIEERDALDTPRHVHEHEDELFVVLEGEHVFSVGDDDFHVGPGATVFAPRGVPHEHRRVVARTGRFLTLTYPAGFEGFFRALAAAERSGEPMDAAYAAVARRYGITWLT